VTTPPRLTQAEYTAFLDSLPVHPSCLYFASKDGNVEEAKGILVKNPNLEVNWTNNEDGWTTFYVACESGCDAIVSILLAHPDIEVNLKTKYGGPTPFVAACYNSSTSCARQGLRSTSRTLMESLRPCALLLMAA